MQRHRLMFLRRIPDEHPIRSLANQRLAGQMVPTPDAQSSRDAERSSRAEVVNLGGSEVDERCQQQEIRSLRLEVPTNGRILGDCPLHGAEAMSEQTARPGTERARSGADPHEGAGCPLA